MEQLELPAAATSAARGRAFLRDYCRRHGIAPEVTDDALLVLSELLGNAFLHARSPAEVCVRHDGRVLHVSVADRSRERPRTGSGRLDATGGRGVLILTTLASDWGVTPEPDGKTVWFELAR